MSAYSALNEHHVVINNLKILVSNVELGTDRDNGHTIPVRPPNPAGYWGLKGGPAGPLSPNRVGSLIKTEVSYDPLLG